MKEGFKNLMHEATRLTRAGHLIEATALISRAMALAGVCTRDASEDVTSRARTDASNSISRTAPMRTESKNVIDVELIEGDTLLTSMTPDAIQPVNENKTAELENRFTIEVLEPAKHGQFSDGSFMLGNQVCCYKFYSPAKSVNGPIPLVVMLHGCTQDPDDFAAGTGMNSYADSESFFVLYPAQSQAANQSKCWNWFKSENQHRGSGEPALIAGMTLAMMQSYNIDPRRVYVAGLSAGGAMAAIVSEVYPEIFAAVAVHSGLPRGAATNVIDALTAMKRGGQGKKASLPQYSFLQKPEIAETALVSIPTIVFHGGGDRIVHPVNGEHLISAALNRVSNAQNGADDYLPGDTHVEQGVSPRGKAYSRSIQRDSKGSVLTEHWVVHGAGHAWSGGQALGSHTDVDGPDASGEIIRFFFEHPKPIAREA
jgi:poly(hydroxyalkanoate) depolymerase family esterase